MARLHRAAALCALLVGCPGPGDSADSAATQAITVGPYLSAIDHGGATAVVRLAAPDAVQCRAWTEDGSADDPVATVTAEASEDGDLCAHCRFDELEPATRYRYGAWVDGEPMAPPSERSFTTAPSPDERVSLTIGLLADADGKDGVDTPAYAALAAEDPAIVLQLGDLDHRDPGTAEDPTVEVWRKMHRQQLAEHSQGQQLDRALLASVPFLHTWDDHDYGANNADRTASFRDLATQAFHEYFPLPPDAPDPDHGLWYAQRWGQVEIYMLDGRSQRDPDDTPDGGGKSLLAGEPEIADQYTWLLGQLAASSATWKILVTGSCFNPHAKQVDSWALYPDEQYALLSFIEDNGVTGVVVVSGDLHSAGGIDDGSFAGLPELSVPTTNLAPPDCTGGPCGSWSHGIDVHEDAAGYGLLRVAWEPETERHTLTMEARGSDGELRRSLTLEPQDALPNPDVVGAR